MNKNDLVTQVAEKASLNKAQAGAAVDAVFATITEALKAGDEVRIVGFGNFVVTERAASNMRDLNKMTTYLRARSALTETLRARGEL